MGRRSFLASLGFREDVARERTYARTVLGDWRKDSYGGKGIAYVCGFLSNAVNEYASLDRYQVEIVKQLIWPFRESDSTKTEDLLAWAQIAAYINTCQE